MFIFTVFFCHMGRGWVWIPRWNPQNSRGIQVKRKLCGKKQTDLRKNAAWMDCDSTHSFGYWPSVRMISYIDAFHVHPWKLIWNLKLTKLKRKSIFKTSIFGFHVNFRGCKYQHQNAFWAYGRVTPGKVLSSITIYYDLQGCAWAIATNINPLN